MCDPALMRRAIGWLAAGTGLAVVSYATVAGVVWYRYGKPGRPRNDEESDPLLDRFMPDYEVVERHHIRVMAPAEVALAAAAETDLRDSAIVAAILRARGLILGAVQTPSGP